MIHLIALIRRDLALAFRERSDSLLVIAFFVIAALLFPFGVGSEPNLLARIGPGVILAVALLAALLSLDRLFQTDYEDGSLELLATGPVPLGLVVTAKIIAHWLTSATAQPVLQSAAGPAARPAADHAAGDPAAQPDRRYRRGADARGPARWRASVPAYSAALYPDPDLRRRCPRCGPPRPRHLPASGHPRRHAAGRPATLPTGRNSRGPAGARVDSS